MSNRGGKREGAGRPKGATSRPQIREYITPEEVKELVEKCKEQAKEGRPELMKFLLEQIFGRAVQPIGNDGDEPFKIAGVEISFREHGKDS